MRTYSSTSREVLSALMITEVSKHNEVSGGGSTTAHSARIRMSPDICRGVGRCGLCLKL
jgi:hypothetical protein